MLEVLQKWQSTVTGHFATADIQLAFGLNALAVIAAGAHPDSTAADVDIAIGLDALWRRGVVIALELSALGYYIHATAIKVGLHIYVDAFAARTGALEP